MYSYIGSIREHSKGIQHKLIWIGISGNTNVFRGFIEWYNYPLINKNAC